MTTENANSARREGFRTCEAATAAALGISINTLRLRAAQAETKTDKYYAVLSGGIYAGNPLYISAQSITSARREAEDHGDTIDCAEIYTRRGVLVGVHRRDNSGDGLRWFRSAL